MKSNLVLALLSACLLGACSTTAPTPVGMKADQFVSYQCDGGKRLQARLAGDGSTVRVRYEGGYELDRKSGNVFEGEGFTLSSAAEVIELMHHGKPVASNCKPT